MEFSTLHQQPKHIAEYAYVIAKHKATALAVFILVFGGIALFTLQKHPVYKAVATIVVEGERTISPVTGKRLDYDNFYLSTLRFNTHSRLILSRPVMEKVVRDLNLDHRPSERDPDIRSWKAFLRKIRKNIGILFGNVPQEDREPDEAALADALRRRIDVREIEDTLLLEIEVLDYDPVMARRIANSTANAYIRFNIESRLRSSQNTLSWMTEQLYAMKKKLEDAEKAFLAYKQREKLFSVEGKQRVIGQKISDFNDAYLKTRNRRMELDARLDQLTSAVRSGSDIRYARSLIQNPLIDTLYQQLLETEVELSRLSKVYKSKHPKVVQVRTGIENTRKKLREEIRKEVENLEAERAVLVEMERLLQQTIQDFENESLKTNEKELQYAILERNVETNRELYETLLSKIKVSDIAEDVDTTNIRIVEEAVTPRTAVGPHTLRSLMWGMVFALAAGVGAAFFRDYLDRGLHTEEDIERYLQVPVLAIIPAGKPHKGEARDTVRGSRTSQKHSAAVEKSS